ncbi:DnaJ (Hsp40) homolog, subfamily C, member 15, isoform CRA_c [Mus musculus]|uniref:DnaJ heat shock protein family (Hsp40) member C15 n=1 Tax=Mus musculus TaxID=10090 RepID=A0A2K6EDK0_MOUSE|nr:DnaJ (Hsp40) homolog, subfamily C, member 15, isoform CRA_c [Mus musculus]
MATGGGVTSREGLRYAEYLPPSAQRSDADIDHTAVAMHFRSGNL